MRVDKAIKSFSHFILNSLTENSKIIQNYKRIWLINDLYYNRTGKHIDRPNVFINYENR